MTWYLPEWDATTTFLHAVASGDTPKVRALLERGAPVETRHERGSTPLGSARDEAVQALPRAHGGER